MDLARWLSRIARFAVWAVFALGASAALARPGQAAPAPQTAPLTLAASAGFDGYYKEGRWLPVHVLVENNGPDARGRLEVASAALAGGPNVVYSRDLDLPAQSRRELFLYVTLGSFATSLEVRLVDQGQALAAPVPLTVRQLSPQDILFGVLAASPSAFNVLADVDPVNGQAYVAQVAAGDLPDLGQAWGALDVLVVSDMDTGALTPEQRRAAADWVDQGGRLLVMGGAGWQKTAAGLNGLLPLTPATARPLTDLGPLAELAPAASPVPAGEAVAAFGALAADATVLAGPADAPLITMRRQGYGQVLYFGADPAFAPLRAWDGLADLFRQALAAPLDQPSWAAGLTNWSSAQSAVDALPDLQLPSPLLICGFLGLYLAVVGPLNYLALRFLKRRELAWITIPATVLAFSLAAYLAGYGLAGVQPTLHQLAIVQVWPAADRARLDQVVGLFSPRRAVYELGFAPGLLAQPVPGYSQPGANPLRFEQGDQPRVLGVRTEIAAVQSFAAEGTVPAPRFEASLTLAMSASTVRLAGTLTNQSELTLTDAVLLAPGGVERLGTFQPGETRTLMLLLGSGRAGSLTGSSPWPITPGTSIPIPPYSPSGVDSTIDDILGTSAYYDDRTLYRRYSLLTAAINTYTPGASPGRGNGVYLAGWSAQPPAPASVLGADYKTEAETLYLIALPTTLAVADGPLTVTPGLMKWLPLEVSATGAAAPYDTTLYAGEHMAFQFQPVPGVAFARPTALTLDLIGTSYSGSGQVVAPAVELWDFQAAEWQRLAGLTYGTTRIEAPERYVGAGGEIRARLSNPGPDTISLSSLEFTLVVEP
ncbi:MAG: hypothetical protein JNK29_08010 [Anaerolineales bacterium]|nr:hypothetical protein [Anaerolineales bacterium]